jgi:methionyl-tRNA synthetase
MKDNFFVTTPIYYINDRPHIGHAYTTIIADVVARYARSKGNKVLFLTGTDENASKTVEAAIKSRGKNKLDELQRQDIVDYTDYMAKKWQAVWRSLNISYDDFIRTTEKRHVDTVEKFLKKVYDRGDIYKGQYKGLYCVGHEAFLTESDLIEGFCPDHKTKPEVVEEENYFFRLSKYQNRLLKYLKEHPDWIRPPERRHEIQEFIRKGLTDISISRPNKGWGIPLPIDQSQIIWVWFDALVNYLTAGENWWPADIHIVGKDIVRFHTITWGAMLLSAGYELPKTVFGHGFFTVDGQKISKSLGNAIDPMKIIDRFGADALRYFLLREIPSGQDGDFSWDRLRERYNADLADNLGNLVQRTIVMAKKYGISTKGPASEDWPLNFVIASPSTSLRINSSKQSNVDFKSNDPITHDS